MNPHAIELARSVPDEVPSIDHFVDEVARRLGSIGGRIIACAEQAEAHDLWTLDERIASCRDDLIALLGDTARWRDRREAEVEKRVHG